MTTMQDNIERYKRAKKYNDVTDNGIVFDWELAGSDGASFELFREPQHTDEDIKNAKSYLRRERDVVSIKITKIKFN